MHFKEKISPQERDQYFREMKALGEKMGALNLPSTYVNTEITIKKYLPELHYGERAKSIVELLEYFPSKLSAKPFIKLITRAGFLNLPDWVYPLIKRSTPSLLERIAVKKSVDLIAIPVREALKDGVAAHSLRRVYG